MIYMNWFIDKFYLFYIMKTFWINRLPSMIIVFKIENDINIKLDVYEKK